MAILTRISVELFTGVGELARAASNAGFRPQATVEVEWDADDLKVRLALAETMVSSIRTPLLDTWTLQA